MANIGQQLQEARSRLGYTLRDVSEKIHVRPEFLAKLEDNTFDIPLDIVYTRGFVRLYAKTLKLDPDQIVGQFNQRVAQLQFSDGVEAERASLGTYTVDKGEEEPGDEPKKPRDKQKVFERYRETDDEPTPPWMLIGSIAGVIVVVFAIVLTLRIFVFKPTEPTDETIANSDPVEEQPTEVSALQSLEDQIVVIVAKAPVYIYVTQQKDNEILFSGRLQTGERKTIVREGEIIVATDQSENVEILKKGKAEDLGGVSGPAKLLIP